MAGYSYYGSTRKTVSDVGGGNVRTTHVKTDQYGRQVDCATGKQTSNLYGKK